MSSTYDNTVFDFDLDFLNQPSTNNAEPDLQAKCDRLRKSVIFFKKRVKVIDHYVTVAKAAKNEVAELRITETQLKNQCKQHHVEIGNFIEKVTRLENEIQVLEGQERLKSERIAELENKILAQQKVYAQYKVLIEEHKLEPIRNDRKKVKPTVTKPINEKEVEILRKENAKLLNLEKVNERLRKEIAKIPNLEKEIENLRKKNTFVSKSEKVNGHNEINRIEQLEKEVQSLCKDNVKISSLEKEIEILHKENAKIPKLEKDMVNLQKENIKIPKLEIEIEKFQKENARIPKLMKEIENLHKEKAKLTTTLQSENEAVSNLNIQISNLQKDIEILRIKNTEFEIENKSLREKVDKIPIEDDIVTLNSTTTENGKLRSEQNKLTGKYKSLFGLEDERSDDNEDDIFEDFPSSPVPNDIVDKESLIVHKDVTVPPEFDTGHSLEYLENVSPSNREIEDKTKDSTISRSPTLLKETPTITIVDHSKNQNTRKRKSHRTSHSKSLSNVANNTSEVTNIVETSKSIRPKNCSQEKECLEINNSLRCGNHTDLELENIFSTMKLHYNVISPIPKTPTGVPNVDSAASSSDLNEKFDLCSSLCYKTVDFMQLLIKLAITQGRDRNKVNINDCDKMIACFESILKSEQILNEINSEHSVRNSNSNTEISDRGLVCDSNNLGTISNPESLKTSSQKEIVIVQNKTCENRLSQNSSLLQEENQKQLLCNDKQSVVISNPSPPDKGNHIVIDKQVEKGLLQSPMSEGEIDKQLMNHSVSEQLATNNDMSKATDSDGSVQDIFEVNVPPVIKRTRKIKKKSKLEKLKKKLEPKYKIRMEKKIKEKLRIKPKQLSPLKRKVTENDTAASLNRKDVYEKAVKFMAEINSKQSAKQAKTPQRAENVQMPKIQTPCLQKNIESSGDNKVSHSVTTRSKRKLSDLFEPCTVVLIKDPLLLSPRKSGNSTSHKEDNKSSPHRSTHNKISTFDIAKDVNNSLIDRAKEDPNFTTHGTKSHPTADKTTEDNISTTDRIEDINNSTTVKTKEDNISTTDRIEDVNNSTTVKTKEYNISTTDRIEDVNNSTTVKTKEDNIGTTDRIDVNNSTTAKTKEVSIATSPGTKEDNNSTTEKAKEDNVSTICRVKKHNNSTSDKVQEDVEAINERPLRKRRRRSSDEPLSIYTISTKENTISTTHKEKEDNVSTLHTVKENNASTTNNVNEDNTSTTHVVKEANTSTIHEVKEDFEPSDGQPIRKRSRRASKEPLVQHKRVLRSTTVQTKLCTEDNIELPKSKGENNRQSIKGPSESVNPPQINSENSLNNNNIVSYEDLDVFSEDTHVPKKMPAPVIETDTDASVCHPKDSILCSMIEKHGVETVRPYEKKIPDHIVKQVCEKIERDISLITQTHDSKKAMTNFVADLRKLNYKHFIAGLIQFLSKPERKLELFGKVKSNPAPAMTKTEQILLYVIGQLRSYWPSVDVVDAVLCSIEFNLFKLNRTPEFDVIESTSHFYALLCRYVRAKSRLRLFILDAMYCIQFKSVPLIKQCLEVWMNIIPLSHMGMAKSPMVTCLVYLLHFYKCDDKFNRVQEIRKILREQYFYKITDWNETKILEMFKNSIKDLKDISIEKKMLRLALIILAKRQGPQWCQNHIVKNILQPMIEKKNVPNNVKEFCVSVIGPLMKPYPVDMKVHCEIAVNQLMGILDNNPSPEMEEAAITSMMYINRHDQRSINKALLSRKMKPMSLALEKTIRDYVKAKPLRIWKKHLSAIAR